MHAKWAVKNLRLGDVVSNKSPAGTRCGAGRRGVSGEICEGIFGNRCLVSPSKQKAFRFGVGLLVFRIFVAVDVGFSLEMFGASSHPMFTKHVTRIYAAAGYDLSLLNQ